MKNSSTREKVIDKCEEKCYNYLNYLSKIILTYRKERKKKKIMRSSKFPSLLSALLAAAALVVTLPMSAVSAAAYQAGEVLFEDDFSNGLSEEYRAVEGSDRIKVEDGVLSLDARGRESVRLLLPESLDTHGDYRIEVSATIESPENDSRWCSVMYRVQKSNYPYYHMCIRQNATLSNGVEFAERTQSNTWNVAETASFSEKLTADKFYDIKVEASGSRVTYSINGEELIDRKGVEAYTEGAIGLQANHCILKVVSIKVTKLINNEVTPRDFSTLAQSESKIIGGMTFSEYVESADDLDSVLSAEEKPANLIFFFNENKKLCDSTFKNEFADAVSVLDRLENTIMPTYVISSEAAADSLIAFFAETGLRDAFVMSSDPSLVAKVRKDTDYVRGVLDLTEKYKSAEEPTTADLLEIRGMATSNMASIVVIPENAAVGDNVKYLEDRLVAVWVAADKMQGSADAFDLLVSGAHGVISDNTALLSTTAATYFTSKTLVRTPLIIGHRGLPSQAPENTLESAILAYENGADVIENDIYLTKDGEIVIMHNNTTGATCDRDISVEGSTLKQLKRLYVNKGYEDSELYSECRIPTLREYYEEFKGKDVQIFIEIKSSNTEIVQKLKELTEEYEMQGQINVITFLPAQVKQMKKVFPEVSVGLLCDCKVSGTGGNAVSGVLSAIQPLGTTYNPSFSGHNSKFICQASMRGIMVYPWTFENDSTLAKFLLDGYNGLTTNYADAVKDFGKRIETGGTSFDIGYGESHTPSATLLTYGRSESGLLGAEDTNSELIILEGSEYVTYENGVMTFAEGSYTVSYTVRSRTKCARPSAYAYDLYSRVVTLNVENVEPLPPEEPTVPTAVTPDDRSSNKNTLIILSVSAVCLVAVAVAAVIVIKKTKKNKEK